jgi:hypothetical protein
MTLCGLSAIICLYTDTEVVLLPAVQNDGQVMTVANFITYHFGATASAMCMCPYPPQNHSTARTAMSNKVSKETSPNPARAGMQAFTITFWVRRTVSYACADASVQTQP